MCRLAIFIEHHIIQDLYHVLIRHNNKFVVFQLINKVR